MQPTATDGSESESVSPPQPSEDSSSPDAPAPSPVEPDRAPAGLTASATAEADADALRQLDGADEERKAAELYGAAADPLPMSDPLAAEPYDFGGGALEPPRPEPARAPAATTRARTLEDLYAKHPEIGTGEKYIIVDRKTPKMWGSAKIDGLLGELHEQLSLAEFQDRYGGGRYELLVQGPTQRLDADGQYVRRTLDRLVIDLPHAPKLGRAAEEDQVRQSAFGAAPDRALELKRLEFDHETRREERGRVEEYRRALSDNRPSDQLWKNIEAAADKRAGEVRESMSESIKTLRTSLEKVQADVERKDEQIQSLRQQIIDTEMRVAREADKKESTRVTELKDRYEADLLRVREEHGKSVEKLAQEHQRQNTDISDRHQRERQDYESRASQERERLREDARARADQLQADAKVRDESIRQNYESRLAEMSRSTGHEVDAVREQRDREIRVMEVTQKASDRSQREGSDLRVQLLESERTRLEAQLDRAAADAAGLRNKFDKTPLEVVKDAQGLLESLGINRDGAQEGDFDWRRGLVSLLGGVLNKDTIKEVAAGLGTARDQNRAQAEQLRRARAMAASRQRQGGVAPQMVGPHTPVAMAAHGPPPAPAAATAAVAAPGAEPLPTAPEEGRTYRPDSVASGARPNWGTSADGPEPEEPTPAEPAEPAAAPAAPQPATPTPGAEPAPTVAEAAAAVSPEMKQALNSLADKLNAAIAVKHPVQEFAASLVGEVGPDVVRQIHSSLAPEQLADAVAAQPGGADTAIATPEGRQYLTELWEAINQALAAPS